MLMMLKFVGFFSEEAIVVLSVQPGLETKELS
jgi:hypothetical protein